MLRLKGKIFWFVIVFGFGGCIEPYTPKDIQFKDQLVVEGFISDEVKNHEVKLSRTASISDAKFIPETEATVSILGSHGEVLNLTEVKPGVYQTPISSGQTGTLYTLDITTKTGNHYQSKPVELKTVPPLSDVTAHFETSPKRGIKINVNTEDPSDVTKFFRWDYVETYELLTPLVSNYEWISGNTVVERAVPINRCWGYDTLNQVLIKSATGQSTSKIVEFPIRFIDEESVVFRVDYSILVRQYALSEEGYAYWHQLQSVNETQGTLSDIQPGTVVGNLVSLTDPNETVLGYFDASAVSQKRVFFHYQDFVADGYKRPSWRDGCKDFVPTLVAENDIGRYMDKNSANMVIVETQGSTPNPIFFEIQYRICCDCTMAGVNVRPPFWE